MTEIAADYQDALVKRLDRAIRNINLALQDNKLSKKSKKFLDKALEHNKQVRESISSIQTE